MATTERSNIASPPSHLAHLKAEEYETLVRQVVDGSGTALATLLGITDATAVTRR